MRLTSLLYISFCASFTLALPQLSAKLDERNALDIRSAFFKGTCGEGGDACPGPILPRGPEPEAAPEPDPRCLAEAQGIPGC